MKLWLLPTVSLWLALTIILQPSLVHASKPTNIREWYQYVKVTAKKYNIDPNLCAALAAGESGKGKQEVRFCWVARGKYHGPYNLHRCFLKDWDITDWRVNTEIGIRTLANKIRKYGSLRSALRHYNTDDKGKKFEGYVNNIRRLQRQYEKRMVFVELKNYALSMAK